MKPTKIIYGPQCPYCGSRSILCKDSFVYPQHYGNDLFVCENFPSCDSYVGTHKNGEPLGRLANKELRQAKMQAHKAFDPLWKSKHMTRLDAYFLLANEMCIPLDECHIGMFDIDQCKQVVDIVDEYYLKLERMQDYHPNYYNWFK